MVASLPTADDVIEVVKTLIASLGTDAFKTNGRVQLYSGPRRLIAAALTHFADNHTRSFKQVARLLTTPIDNTRIGQFLEKYDGGKDIYEFFRNLYGVRSKIARTYADQVMRHASREFIRSAYGRVFTAVCGASLDRIFYEIELPELIANRKVKTVNGVSMQMVRDFYAINPYEAFRLICISELIEARHYALKVKTPESIQEYKERRKFFALERQDTAKHAPAVSPIVKADIKLRKRQILVTYRLAAHGKAISVVAPSVAPAPVRRRKRSKRPSHAPA